MTWIRRCLAVIHLALGLIFVAGGVSYLVLGVFGLPQLLTTGSRTQAPGTLVLVAAVVLLPEMALGAAMLVLARWLWLGHPRLRAALLAIHAVVLLLGALFIKWGFDAVAAAERSTAGRGGLLSPAAFFPFAVGVPLVALALSSVAVAFWVVPLHESDPT